MPQPALSTLFDTHPKPKTYNGKSIRIIVTGGRNYLNRIIVYKELDAIHERLLIKEVIEGGARGADALARDWAGIRSVKSTTIHADWDKHGKRAGYLRNLEMAQMGADLVVAFPGGTGTANMIHLANSYSIPVLVIKP